jgi:hypothetical protein
MRYREHKLRNSQGLDSMSELKLTSRHPGSIKSLVEGAISATLRSTEAGIQTTEQRLQEFEQKYHIPTAEFIQRYENDEFQETLELAEWIGEYRMLQGLKDSLTHFTAKS